MTPRFEDLIERHHDEIFAYLWRLLGKERQSDVALEAEDTTQEVFMRAFESYLGLRRDSNYRAWLYKIATHCAYTKLRQAKNRREQNLVHRTPRRRLHPHRLAKAHKLGCARWYTRCRRNRRLVSPCVIFKISITQKSR